jgi:chromosome segregation ATPase
VATKTTKESRLDRIEKELILFLESMRELRGSQKRTDKQILELRDSQKKTDEMFRRTDERFLELRESQNRTYEMIRTAAEEIWELSKSRHNFDEGILDLKEAQEITEQRMNRTFAKLDRIGAQLADLGLVQGEVAEDLFYRNVKGVFRKRRLQFKEVLRNLKKKGVAEYDIVAVNGEAVLVVEVKNKLEKRMVDRFLKEKLPNFPEVFPEFRGRKILGAMGALVVKEEVGRYAEKAGLFVLTQTDEGGAALLNKEGFKAKDFS